MPSLYQQADAAAAQQQGFYIRASKAEYYFVLIAALFSCFFLTEQPLNKYFARIIAGALTCALFIRMMSKVQQWGKKWFEARAIAESVKTSAWRYIMRVPPYQDGLDVEAIDSLFIKEIDTIFRTAPSVSSIVTSVLIKQGVPITDHMRSLRSGVIGARKDLYINERVADQKEWYSLKAKMNGDYANIWFWVISGIEFVGVGVAYLMINQSTWIFNPLGFITTLTGIFLAWVQINKYQELKQTYAVAAQELSLIECQIRNVQSEDRLIERVRDAEDAISREHTMWCAKNR